MNMLKPRTQIFDGRQSVLKILLFLVSKIALPMVFTDLLNVFRGWGMHSVFWKPRDNCREPKGLMLFISLGGKGPYQ